MKRKYVTIAFISLLSLVILVVIITMALFFHANREVKSLDLAARGRVAGRFIQLTDGLTHYELAGPDTGKLVVLVHGFSVPYYIWDSTFQSLVQAGFRVLRYDEFGRGFSDRPDKIYEASLYRRQLSELLDKLKIPSVYAVAGLSFGGAVVTDFALYYPALVNKVILIDPVYPGNSIPPYPEALVRYKMAISPDDQANGQLTDLKYPARFPHWVDQYKVQMQYKGFRHALVSTLFHYAPAGGIRANYQSLDSLHKPVLLIWGKEDHTVPFPFSDSLRQVLHTSFVPVEDAAHLPTMEKPGFVNEKIVAFLKDSLH
jgi:pimeloyl-ACP methyl ester carboxylesterase